MSHNPADLDSQLRDELEALRNLRRRIVALDRDYATLDPADLAVDDLGDPITPGAALAGVRTGLDNIIRATELTDDAFDTAMRYSSRILRPRR